jgi:hypothetical protein
MNRFPIFAFAAIAAFGPAALAPATASALSLGSAGVGAVPGVPVRGIAVQDQVRANPGTFTAPLSRRSGINGGRARDTRQVVHTRGLQPRQTNPGQAVVYVPYGGTNAGPPPPPYVPFGGAGSGSAGPPVPGGIGATRNVSKD